MKLAQLKSNKRVITAYRPSKTRLLVDIASLRGDRGITLRQVEKVTGISNASLCQIEHGCTPALATALTLAAFIDLPVEQIWALKNGKRK